MVPRALLLACAALGADALSLRAAPLARGLQAPPLRRAAVVATTTLEPSSVLPVAPEDEWIARVDLDAFGKECRQLGDRLEKGQGEADIRHLKKMVLWSNLCGAVGMATMWMRPNIVSVMGLSLWTMSRWTMIAHHTCHGGYNKQDDGSGRFTSMGFALGSVRRRAMDWLDWMLPEAWNVEHNNLHHFRTGEPGDPDLVERNLQTLRDIPMVPRPVKYAFVAIIACMWKWYYYAPNTYKQLKMHELRRSGKGIPESVDIHAPFAITKFLPGGGSEAPALGYNFFDYLMKVAGPYLAIRFFLLPAPLLLINPLFFQRAVVNLLLADALSNLHSFIIIATNHAGDDMYQFENSVTPKSGSFYMRQVITSVDFRTSNGIRADGTARPVHGHTADANDFMHGWLNYQIEHHLWPQLSMLSYQKAAPELRAICAKHGVPYVQHSVFRRLKKTADIMVGATSMRKFRPEWEKEADRFEWKS